MRSDVAVAANANIGGAKKQLWSIGCQRGLSGIALMSVEFRLSDFHTPPARISASRTVSLGE